MGQRGEAGARPKPGDLVEGAPEGAVEGGGDAALAGRRRFLGVGVGVMGTGLAAVVAAPAVPYLLFPLGHEVTRGGGTFVAVGERAQFSAVPVKVDIFAERIDAWNRIDNVKLGSAWVVEREGELVAFSSVCPHLGCAIDYDPEAARFKCPCHRSAFGLDGARELGPAPRGLDRLEIADEDGVVSVLYARFRQGVSEKEPI